MDPVEITAGHVEPPDVGAGGDQRLAERDLVPVGERDRTRAGVELGRRDARQDLDLLLLIPVGIADQRVLA